MAKATQVSEETCPSEESHAGHYWRYADESPSIYHKCKGYLIPHIDVYERPKDGT